jgi:hypothetical protein
MFSRTICFIYLLRNGIHRSWANISLVISSSNVYHRLNDIISPCVHLPLLPTYIFDSGYRVTFSTIDIYIMYRVSVLTRQ